MFMRNVLIAAVSLQALVEGVLAQDKVTLTKTVTRRKPKTSSTAEPYEVPEVTVVPTSYITDGTTIFVDETVTIPCSKCTAASTAGDADAEVTSEVITTVVTSDAGNVSDQTAEVTVVPTSYVTDGTTIWVDETITIPCSKCEATSTAGDADAEGTSEAVSEATTEDVSEPTTSAETLSTAEATDSGFITEQTADITTVVPTSFITRGTTRYVNETITIPCTKCDAKTKTAATEDAGETTLDTSAALETTGATQDAAETSAETSAPTEEETTAATQDAEDTTDIESGTKTANTATGETEASTKVETTIPTTINLSTGYGQNTVTSQHGPFANTTVPAGAETTAVDELPSAVSSDASTSSAVVSKVNKPVIVVIREVTIFHRTVVIGAACPPVKRGNSGDFVVGTGSDEKSFTEIGEALSDACDKQFKACTGNAGKNFEVSDCQRQLTICLSDASSTAKAPTPITKESTETASIVLPSDADVTGESKSYVGGNVVISTRTLTVSESCVISDGTPIVEGPTSTGAETTAQTADAETTVSSALGGETTEASEAVTGTATGVVESTGAVTIITLTKSDGEVSTTALTLTNGVPTGTGVVPGKTQVESSADAVPTTEAVIETTAGAETTAAGEVSSALGGETTEAGETVTTTATGVVVITLTKSDGEISVTSLVLSTGVPTGTGAVTVPGGNGDQTTAEAPAETSETAIGQDTTLPAGDITVTKTVTNQVTETVTVPCGANGGQTANVVTSVVTSCPAPTTLATTPVRTPETVYVTATVEAARLRSSVPAPERFRRMLGLAW